MAKAAKRTCSTDDFKKLVTDMEKTITETPFHPRNFRKIVAVLKVLADERK